MRTVRWLGVLAAGAVLVPAAWSGGARAAEGDDTGVHRMTIRNGTVQTVHYFGRNLSSGDQSSLRDLERSENQSNYADGLMALRQMYIRSERELEPYRTTVQRDLYARIAATPPPGYGTLPYLGSFASYVPFNYGGYGFGPGFGGYGGFGYGGYGGFGGGGGGQASRAAAASTLSQMPLQQAMAGAIAQQASPDFAAAAARAYDRALARASESSAIRPVLGLPDRGGKGIRPAAGTDRNRPAVVVTLNNGDTITGDSLEEMGDFFVVKSADRTERIRKSEVTHVSERKRPANPGE